MLRGQIPVKSQFEAASIKLTVPGRIFPHGPVFGGPGTSDPGQISYTNQRLKDLIFQAYDLMPYQLSVPSWMEQGERFDIFAKVPAGATKAEIPLMLRNLLETRFQMKVRHEPKEVPTYTLALAKDGSKLKEYAALLPDDFVEAAKITGYDKDGVPIVRQGYATGITGPLSEDRTFISIARQSIRSLSQLLSKILQQPVVDRTGLTGRYDVRLVFANFPVASTATPSSEAVLNGLSQASDPAPSLFDALRKQAGLTLEAKRQLVDFLVVERADRMPTEN
ncbi:MAG: TIGR03435 family protein [Ignavibacteriota bacterium]